MRRYSPLLFALLCCLSGLALGCSSDDAGVAPVMIAPSPAAPSMPEETVAPTADFLGGLFAAVPVAEPQPAVTPAEATPEELLSGVDDLVQPDVGDASVVRVIEAQAQCTDTWRATLLDMGREVQLLDYQSALERFRLDFETCHAEQWAFQLRAEVSPACVDVVYAEGLGPLQGPLPTGWSAEHGVFWMHFDESPMSTGGGCWMYHERAGWMERTGDFALGQRLLTAFEVDASMPGFGIFREQALSTCDHRLRSFLTADTAPLDAAGILASIEAFRGAGENLECLGAGWMPVAEVDSELCLGVPFGPRPTGRYDDGAVVLHWSDSAQLGDGGSCWTFDPVEVAWFRSIDRGPVEPGDADSMEPESGAGMVGERDGRAFETGSPVAGIIPLVGDDLPLLAYKGRTEVCDLVLKSVLMLNPMARSPADYTLLINAVQQGVDGGVCVVGRWAPEVAGRAFRDRVAGVALPESLHAGTSYDVGTGSLRVVFFDDARPFDGSKEWVWLSDGTGWINVR